MKYKNTKFLGIISLSLLAILSFAQQPQSKVDEEKQMREAIDKQIDDMTSLLDLEDWQVFYLDSIMTHNYYAMRDELKSLSAAKVSNSDVYIRVQDKWMEQSYNAYNKLFTTEQWNKYLKSGAGRDKRARDKREAKRNN